MYIIYIIYTHIHTYIHTHTHNTQVHAHTCTCKHGHTQIRAKTHKQTHTAFRRELKIVSKVAQVLITNIVFTQVCVNVSQPIGTYLKICYTDDILKEYILTHLSLLLYGQLFFNSISEMRCFILISKIKTCKIILYK